MEGLAVNVEMPAARRTPLYTLGLKLAPEEREEELLVRAWPLCDSDLSLSFPSLGSLFSVLQCPGPTATSGNGEGSWTLWELLLLSTVEQLLLPGLKSIRKRFLLPPPPGGRIRGPTATLSSGQAAPSIPPRAPKLNLQAAAPFPPPRFSLPQSSPVPPLSGHLSFLAALQFLFPFVPGSQLY